MPRQVLHLAATASRRAARGSRSCRGRPTARWRGSASLASTNSKWFITFASRSTCAGVEPERLPYFARRTSSAVGDDVGGHGRAVLSVLLVDVLDDALAAIAARQIEIDVGPLAALLRQEALEEQVHPHRIDGRDAQAVADGAVRRRAAPLHEDVVLAAEVHDVPDDQEVAGELELLDEVELARDLRAGAVVIRPVAVARADVRRCGAGTTPAFRPAAPDIPESGSRDRPS